MIIAILLCSLYTLKHCFLNHIVFHCSFDSSGNFIEDKSIFSIAFNCLTAMPSFSAETFLASGSHEIAAPSFSNIKRIGTMVLPSMIAGGA